MVALVIRIGWRALPRSLPRDPDHQAGLRPGANSPGWYTVEMDIVTIGAALKAARDLYELTKPLRESVPAVTEKILELQNRISDVQGTVLASQQREFVLTEQCRELQEELRRVNDWETEKARYVLRNIDHKFVYARKPDACTFGEGPHWLCARCFEDHKKSYLQSRGVLGANRHWDCPRCKAHLSIRQDAAPQ